MTLTFHPATLSAIRSHVSREGKRLVIHEPRCTCEPCTCVSYAVGPYDPRPTVMVLEAAAQRWRDH